MSVNAVDHASHADSGTNRAGDHLSPDGFDYNRIQARYERGLAALLRKIGRQAGGVRVGSHELASPYTDADDVMDPEDPDA